MALPTPTTPFVWGAGGAMKTPEQIARDREIAAALMNGGMDYSPVGHWLQGAARAAQAGAGALKERWAGEAETAGREGFQSRWDNVFGGAAPVQTSAIDPVAAALTGAPQTASDATAALAAVPSGDQAGYIRQGLITRGLPEHVADAFLLNFQDESGLNSGINEAEPIVPGSRGGYGLYQLTGPRRVAYEAYAAERGVDPSNVDAQLDFMMSELQGPEARAAKSILSAPDTGSAAAAIVNDFLRPAEEHRARRVAQYTGGTAPVQAGGGNRTQVAQAAPQYDMNALLGLASDPWANDTQRSIINSLVGNQMQQADPSYQLDMQIKQAQLAELLNPKVEAPKPIEVGGVLLDPTTYQPIFDSRAPTAAPKPIEVGGVLLDPVTFQPIFDSRQPEGSDPTAAMQNYEYLVANGVPPDQAIERAFSGGVTVNTGDQGPRVGTIPPSMALVEDPSNPTGYRMETIPGSPEAMAQEAAAAALATGQETEGTYADIVTEDIGRALTLLEQDPTFTTGMFGAALGNWKGSNADRLDQVLNTVRSNVAFDRLQLMRESSPTGGALGSVTENELKLLQGAIGSLERSNPDDLAYNLKRVQEIYDRVMQKAAAYPNAKQFGFNGAAPAPASGGQSTVPASDIDALLEKYQ